MHNTTPHKSGDVYGDVMLSGKSYISGHGRRKRKVVEVICDCGKIFYPLFENIRRHLTKSCGCKTNSYISKANTTHGLTKNYQVHPILQSYRGMVARCNDKDNYDYGSKGITVCDEWVNDFKAFYDWSIENGWDEGLTIDRYPNTKGNYEPNNCRWATPLQQARNKSNNVLLTAFGEIKTMSEWAQDDRCKVGYGTLTTRVKRHGWCHEDAITKSPQIHNKCQVQS